MHSISSYKERKKMEENKIVHSEEWNELSQREIKEKKLVICSSKFELSHKELLIDLVDVFQNVIIQI